MDKIIKPLVVLKKTIKEIILLLSVQEVPEADVGDFLFKSAKFSDLRELEVIYNRLNGTHFTKSRRMSLFFNIKKRLLVVKAKDNGFEKIVAMNFYYLNSRDFKDKTIHEGFIGVLPEYEGRGLATKMRKLAKEHFAKAGFKGISTRISKENLASLKSAEKLGFKPIEEYFDPVMDEDRYYMICEFGECCE